MKRRVSPKIVLVLLSIALVLSCAVVLHLKRKPSSLTRKITETHIANMTPVTDLSHIVISPDGTRVASIGAIAFPGKPARLCVWVSKGPNESGGDTPVEDIDPTSLHLTAAGEHRGYVAIVKGKQQAIIDGRPEKAFDRVVFGDTLFSQNGAHYAYMAQEKGKWCVIVDGKGGHRFEAVTAPQLSADGTVVVYAGTNGSQARLFRNSIAIASGAQVKGFQLSADGAHLAYILLKDGQDVVVHDGRVIERMPPSKEPLIELNGDGSAVIYTRPVGGKVVVVSGFTVSPPVDRVLDLIPSPDPARFAAVAETGQKLYVIDGAVISKPYDEIAMNSLVFSSDGRHFAYGVELKHQWFIIADGKQYGPYRNLLYNAITFSPDGRFLAYAAQLHSAFAVYVNGVPQQGYQVILPGTVKFTAPDSLYYFVVKTGGKPIGAGIRVGPRYAVYRVDEHLRP